MNPEILQWASAGAVFIGAAVSVFRPDNPSCPINLSPANRAFLAAALGAAQAGLQSFVAGTPWWQAGLTAVTSTVAALAVHGGVK